MNEKIKTIGSYAGFVVLAIFLIILLFDLWWCGNGWDMSGCDWFMYGDGTTNASYSCSGIFGDCSIYWRC